MIFLGTMKKIYTLNESIDECILNTWIFMAENIEDLLQQIFSNEQILDRLGFGVYKKYYTPPSLEELATRISTSHVDGDSESGFEVFSFDVGFSTNGKNKGAEVYSFSME